VHDLWKGANVAGRVDLYIPSPPMADKKQALDFHLAVRNLFSWVYRRSMVGQHLGSALIALMDSMREFRSPGVDNVEDILSYADEEGYLEMASQPVHALAMLHFAEYSQLKDLYVNAFAHCAGMADCLYTLPGYQVSLQSGQAWPIQPTDILQGVSSITRKLLRRAQFEVENKLSKAGSSLRNFLEDDLSEANLGLTAGGRAHLERFRTFLLAFYSNRLGYYPPSPLHTRSSMWDPEIYRRMRNDFEALYEFLVDKRFSAGDSGSISAQGGICALQSVHAFDLRHKYRPLPHPLPLLPEIATSAASKRTSWFGRSDSKRRPDTRLLSLAALVKASNSGSPCITRNSLVTAYRRFEEDSLSSQIKFDKIEKLTQADARKIRWVLIYGVYQTLRSCTDAPPEVRDTTDVRYSLAISTIDLPWKEAGRFPVRRTGSRMSTISVISPIPSLPSSGATTSVISSEIRPDIDYFATAHRDNSVRSPNRNSMPLGSMPPTRSGSLAKALSRTGSLRKTLGSLRGEARRAPAIVPGPARNAAYHEIVVHGYGNGTNEVHVEAEVSGSASLANRSASTASNSSSESSGNASDTPRSDASWGSSHTSMSDRADKASEASRRPSVASNSSSVYSTPDDMCPPLPRRSSARKSLVMLFDEQGKHEPLSVRRDIRLPDDPDRWRVIEEKVNELCEAVPAGRFGRAGSIGDGDIPEWDSFCDVGGLTALPPV
jgi:hypothetical protein